jgi:hypothetical protein
LQHSRTDYLDIERYLAMSINDASPEMWNKLQEKYKAMADEEFKYDFRKDQLEYPSIPDPDPVNNPQHYNTGNIECIEAIQESMSSEAFKGYLKGNTMKYLWRYDYKGKASEDLEKAGWYLNKLIKEVS